MLLSNTYYRSLKLEHAGQMVELTIRPIKLEDAPALQTHHNRLSSDSVFYRFHGFKKLLSDSEAQTYCTVDGKSQAAVVAVRSKTGSDGQPQEEIEGVARYYLTEPTAAEMAIVVRDSYQGHGLGKALLEELIIIARRSGIDYLDALVLAENWHMRHMLHKMHYPLTTKTSGSVIAVRVCLVGLPEPVKVKPQV